jgi:hypothetical protein
MAMNKIEIESYKLERGENYVAIGSRYTYDEWHRIFLVGKPDPQGVQKQIEMIFANNRFLANYFSEGVGYVDESANFILVRWRIKEFEPIYDILRSEKPVFFEHDQYTDLDNPSNPNLRIHVARITTSREDTGEGPEDFNRP